MELNNDIDLTHMRIMSSNSGKLKGYSLKYESYYRPLDGSGWIWPDRKRVKQWYGSDSYAYYEFKLWLCKGLFFES